MVLIDISNDDSNPYLNDSIDCSVSEMTTDISVSVRWDPVTQQEIEDYDYDGGNSSSRLFERSRIKALAGNPIAD